MQKHATDNYIEKALSALALHGQWDIDLEWGAAQLSQYIEEKQLVAQGVPFAELGISERRMNAMPCILSKNADGTMYSRVLVEPRNLASTEVPPGSIGHIKLFGVMRANDSLCNRGVESIISDTNILFSNTNISGILFEVNSGGGESLAGSMLQNALAESPKPVVTYFHLMASAALRAALRTDEIIAAGEGARAGSIGTYVTLDKSFARYYTSYYEDVYADKSSKKNYAFREYLSGNLAPLKKEVNAENEQFLSEVAKYRPLKGDIEDTLSGAMFYARTAKQRGLVDGIGTFSYALARLQANIRYREK